MPLSLSHRLALASAAVSAILLSRPVQAQIVPDGTLGTQVFGACGGTGGDCGVTNGTTRGNNLFHSLQQFSLPNPMDRAGFVTAPTIQNVIVRVTGVGQPFISNINGVIVTLDAAFNLAPRNFFLLNPNGIVFGPGATLLNGGSFLATTAERMLFQDGVVFSARDQTVAPLLTVSVPIGLQFGQTPGAIQMQDSRLSAGATDLFGDFALVGGDVILDNSVIRAPGRRVELGGVGKNDTVDLRLTGDLLSLNLPAGTLRRDITLTNGSIVSTAASTGGGALVVTGRNIVLNRSFILTGILFGTDNAVTNQAGDITIDASGNLQLTQGSLIRNQVNPNATGQGGNTTITAADIRVRDGSAIGANTSGNGNAGNVRVAANTIALDGASGSGGIFSTVSTGTGQGGTVTLNTDSLTVTNGALVSASTGGNGNAGDVHVTANTIILDGIAPNDPNVSGIGSITLSTGIGQGGNITVFADFLSITNGAAISAGTFGNGDAGNVWVTANTIALNGISSRGRSPSRIDSQVTVTGKGKGGNVTTQAGSLTITNGGNISAGTSGVGDAGNVRVFADAISIDGTPPDSLFASEVSSGIFSTVEGSGVLIGSGRGGDIAIDTNSLSLTNGATVSAGTSGNGDGGNVRVRGNTVAIDGTTPDGQTASGIQSEVGQTGIGRGGDVTLELDSLRVTRGGKISASTAGNGDAGNLRVVAKTAALDGISFNGQFTSGILSEVFSTGQGRGGDIDLTLDALNLTNGATVSSSAFGVGSAGNLDITAQNIQLDRSSITATSVSGDGANITLNVRDLLLLRYGSQISTTAGSDQFGGNGGNITINAPNGFIVGVKGENSDISANAFTGSGGRVNITTQGIYGLQFRPRLTEFSDITASSTFGVSGVVAINTLGIDPSRGLQQLPVGLVDPSNRIDQKCAAGSGFRRSSFTVTGRGGLPENPLEPLQSGEGVASWVEVGSVEQSRGRINNAPHSALHPPNSKAPTHLVEADSLRVDKDGSVQLVASQSISESGGSWGLPTCALEKERDR